MITVTRELQMESNRNKGNRTEKKGRDPYAETEEVKNKNTKQ